MNLLRTAVIVLMAVSNLAAAQTVTDPYRTDIATHRENLDYFFRDRILSPLTKIDRVAFDGLSYFPVDPAFRLTARFEPAQDTSTFAMPTYNNRTLRYSHFGTVHVLVGGRVLQLKAFRREDEQVLRNFLLIPFRDASNGEETYEGGRYIEITPPESLQLELDFNRAMNPWCAYDATYACPIPPPENHLPMRIPAGEKRFK